MRKIDFFLLWKFGQATCLSNTLYGILPKSQTIAFEKFPDDYMVLYLHSILKYSNVTTLGLNPKKYNYIAHLIL